MIPVASCEARLVRELDVLVGTAAADPMVFRGPDLGPFGSEVLEGDNCHLTAAGITSAGRALVAYFDTP
ncbi:hypothetical protein JYT86_00230 [bacterium AH-315-N03]|nr:hypothetical protein [bacterium AH-315-N03]